MGTGLWREHRDQEVTFLFYETSAKLLKLTFQEVGEKTVELDMAEEVEELEQVEEVEELEQELEQVEEEEEMEGDKSER